MRISIQSNNMAQEKKYTGTVKGLLKQLGINPETVIVVRGNELLTVEDMLSDKDEITLLSVVSGG